jgi:hypothetical protein
MQDLRKIHVIFKTHLDVGFTDYAANVVANYFEHYIPQAIRLAGSLREEGGPERFVWTTGSWLIYEYLEQAGRRERAEMEAAIAAGDIAWHGLPFTTHTELMDVELARFGLTLAQELDQRFGKRTIAAKMTDVPGHTRGLVPLLAEAGIRFLHIGVNPASTPPDVPPVFRWQSPDGSEVTVMYHKGTYGDLMAVPGMDEAIAFAHTGDNLGPQGPEEIRAIFADFAARFPDVEAAASTMDAFAAGLEAVRAQLPVVTQELGDTWIHGVGSDPQKVARFRELLRLRMDWLENGLLRREDAAYRLFSRRLLPVPEHTWGMDEKTHLADYTTYAAGSFLEAQQTPAFQRFADSWAEQRAYIDSAVEALGDSQPAQQARAALAALAPRRPDRSAYQPVAEPEEEMEAGALRLRFDARNGALIGLFSRGERRAWAGPTNPMGLFRYQTFSQEDYDRFYRAYNFNEKATRAWAVPDLTKPGIGEAGAVSATWQPRLDGLYRRDDEQGTHLLLELLNEPQAVEVFGCPALLTIEIDIPAEENTLHYTVQWFGKNPCRLPEALWFSFTPRVRQPTRWLMDKLGQEISPLEVARGGGRKLHAVGQGAHYVDGRRRIQIETLDAPLLAPGERRLLEFDNRPPALSGGMHFLLFNNLWGTNFPMWNGEDARFRFVVRM